MSGALRGGLVGAPFVFLSIALAASACGSVDGDRTEQRASAILGGAPAPEQSGVVFVYDVARGSLCSGSLLAPNLVLTARHCLAPLSPVEGQPVGTFVCGTTTFGATSLAGSIEVGDAAAVDDTGLVLAQEVLVPEGDASCETDIALLVLAAPLSFPTLTPRLDAGPSVGASYTAVGFGAESGRGSIVGTRRERGGFTVACVGACGAGVSSTGSDWVGNEGVCQGDSGGPALDASGLVIGVASRAAPDCTTPVYGDVASWAALVRNGALRAASAGGYPAPAWATPPVPPELQGGCDVAPRAGGMRWFAWAITFVLGCLGIRRRGAK